MEGIYTSVERKQWNGIQEQQTCRLHVWFLVPIAEDRASFILHQMMLSEIDKNLTSKACMTQTKIPCWRERIEIKRLEGYLYLLSILE